MWTRVGSVIIDLDVAFPPFVGPLQPNRVRIGPIDVCANHSGCIWYLNEERTRGYRLEMDRVNNHRNALGFDIEVFGDEAIPSEELKEEVEYALRTNPLSVTQGYVINL